ncbi:autotransporter domain-containing protein [Azospirillum sp. RWY-5-1]|uniref:Autotransporter domain-containing protein n=1 Tax=Azospirillum oleiclasticum TaxID=2735135 RepID=A0ABX2T8G8_9PROT|nr:autotransporter domain-containing protein [Azospirillum oleiclasticum]NYZ13323.1 autotransporter domain-containing protein [Azospirillum oleiclasticum]NYZ20484.1 autotransporter domain-containing protein [Azospirillum oleiclasticum]
MAGSPAGAQTLQDAEYVGQEGLELIGAGVAHTRGITGRGVIVGVVDSGTAATHPEFAGAIRSLHMAGAGVSDQDTNGHGSHVAGIILARRDGAGIEGVAYNASLVGSGISGELFDSPGTLRPVSETDPIANRLLSSAFGTAVREGAQVINASLGLNPHPSLRGPDNPRRTAVDVTAAEFAATFPTLLATYRAGVAADRIFVFATGNESEADPDINAGLPYRFPELQRTWLAVGATGLRGEETDYTNRCGVAAAWCVFAPGGGDDQDNEGIRSVRASGGYVRFSGTSMAAPHVTGVAALLIEAFPNLTPEQIVDLILVSAVDMGQPGVDEAYGHGFVSVERALRGPVTTATDPLAVNTNAYDVAYALDFSGDGGLTKTGGGTLMLSGHSRYTGTTTVSAGTLSVTGSLASPVTVETGGTLRGTGTIGGATTVYGTLAPGNSPGMLTFTAPVTLAAGSTTRIELDGTGNGAGNYSRVVVTTAADALTAPGLAAGGTLAPVLRDLSAPATNGFTPVLGDRFTIIAAAGGVSGGFAGMTQPTAGLAAGTRLDTAYTATTVELFATPTAYADLSPLGLSQTANQRAVGAAVDALRPAAGTRGGDAVNAAFLSLYDQDATGVLRALEQAGGTLHADALSAGLSAGRLFGRAVENRLSGARDSAGATQAAGSLMAVQVADARRAGAGMDDTGAGLAGLQLASSASDSGWSVWTRVMGGFMDRSGDGNAAGATARTGAGLVGADRLVAPDLLVGGGLGYARTVAKARNGGGDADIDRYQALAYAGWTPGPLAVDAQLGYAFTQYDSSRPIDATGAQARGDADGHDLSAALSIGYRMPVQGVTVEPRAGFRVDRIHRDDLTETGAGLFNLSVEDETLLSARSHLGVRAAYALSAGETRLLIDGRLGWEHEFADTGARVTAAMGGVGYSVDGSRTGRDAAVGGVGIAGALGEGVALVADYGFEVRRDQTDHAVTAGLRIRW